MEAMIEVSEEVPRNVRNRHAHEQVCDVCSGRGPWLLDKSGYYMMYVCTRCKQTVERKVDMLYDKSAEYIEQEKRFIQDIPYLSYNWRHKLRGWEHVWSAIDTLLPFAAGVALGWAMFHG
jgi:hypothetical protein